MQSHVYSIPSSYPYCNTTSSLPLLLKTHSERSAFPLALRGTRVVPLLLKQFSSELETEAEVIPTPLINLIHEETDARHFEPRRSYGWVHLGSTYTTGSPGRRLTPPHSVYTTAQVDALEHWQDVLRQRICLHQPWVCFQLT